MIESDLTLCCSSRSGDRRPLFPRLPRYHADKRGAARRRQAPHGKIGVQQAPLSRDDERLHLCGCGCACLCPRKPAIDLVNAAVDEDEFQTLSPQPGDFLAKRPMTLRRQCSNLKALVPKIGAM